MSRCLWSMDAAAGLMMIQGYRNRQKHSFVVPCNSLKKAPQNKLQLSKEQTLNLQISTNHLSPKNNLQLSAEQHTCIHLRNMISLSIIPGNSCCRCNKQAMILEVSTSRRLAQLTYAQTLWLFLNQSVASTCFWIASSAFTHFPHHQEDHSQTASREQRAQDSWVPRAKDTRAFVKDPSIPSCCLARGGRARNWRRTNVRSAFFCWRTASRGGDPGITCVAIVATLFVKCNNLSIPKPAFTSQTNPEKFRHPKSEIPAKTQKKKNTQMPASDRISCSSVPSFIGFMVSGSTQNQLENQVFTEESFLQQ